MKFIIVVLFRNRITEISTSTTPFPKIEMKLAQTSLPTCRSLRKQVFYLLLSIRYKNLSQPEYCMLHSPCNHLIISDCSRQLLEKVKRSCRLSRLINTHNFDDCSKYCCNHERSIMVASFGSSKRGEISSLFMSIIRITPPTSLFVTTNKLAICR
jgi:hypothetical protein